MDSVVDVFNASKFLALCLARIAMFIYSWDAVWIPVVMAHLIENFVRFDQIDHSFTKITLDR
jgi:hypothetical protein